MKSSIRKIESKDRDEIFNMMKEFYASPAIIHKASDEVLYKDIDECLNNDDLLTCFVITVDNAIAGYMMLAKCFSTEFGGVCMWIEDCFIKSKYRGMGLGKEIFSYIENEYAGKIVRFKLEVEKSNIPAYELYKKKGYNQSDYIVMTKEI